MTTAIAIQPSVLPSGIGHISTTYSYPKLARKVKSSIRPEPMISTGDTAIARVQKERPCDACRKRKTRCVIHERQSSCTACGYHGQECTFLQSSQPRKRRLESGGQDGGNVKKRLPEAEARPSRSSKTISDPNIKTETKSLLFSHASTNSRHLLRQTSAPNIHRQSRYIGDTTDLEPLFFDLLPFDANGERTTSAGKLRKNGNGPTFLEVSDGEIDELEPELSALTELEEIVKPHGPALVDLYFSVVHPSFPIVEEFTFRQDYVNGYNAVSPELLAGIYVVALQWWDQDARLVAVQRPSTRKLEDVALRIIGDSLHRPRLSIIQAGLLFSQRSCGESRELMAQLVNTGYELGLHMDCSTWKMPDWEISLRKRLAWALYMQDKWSSIIYGRPSQIAKVNWAVRPLTEDDLPCRSDNDKHGDDLCGLEKGSTLFVQMVALTEILSEVLDTFYTLKATQEVEDAGGEGTRVILERAKPVQIKLKEWFSRLSGILKVDSSISGKLSSTGSLHLAYFATEITLHRCIIRSLSVSGTDPYLHHICRSAAKTRLISAMDFVNRLKPEQLQSFWYFASKTNFALIGTFGSLLRATAPGKEEAEFYKTRLEEYRWSLSVSSKSAPFLDHAVKSLDTSSSLLTNLTEKPSVSANNQSDATSVQWASSTQEKLMTDATVLHVGQIPGYFDADFRSLSQQHMSGGLSSNASGLVSPSTSNSGGSSSQEAYMTTFASY
ncbi:MAG: Fungal specific transcription factor [Pleopsidium flavum]|nr:MAG: Fungal specific transcription factor [Pleopsidium flavum]